MTPLRNTHIQKHYSVSSVQKKHIRNRRVYILHLQNSRTRHKNITKHHKHTHTSQQVDIYEAIMLNTIPKTEPGTHTKLLPLITEFRFLVRTCRNSSFLFFVLSRHFLRSGSARNKQNHGQRERRETETETER